MRARLTTALLHEVADVLGYHGAEDRGRPCQHGRTTCLDCGAGLSTGEWAQALAKVGVAIDVEEICD